MLPASRHRAPSPDYWRFWWTAPIMLFVGILVGGFAGQARASTIDKDINVCAELRSGTSLAVIESELLVRGYTDSDAGAFTGKTILAHCPDQKVNAINQVNGAGT